MNYEALSFKTYSWSIGTTSFRVKEVNYKIEKQLRLLKELFVEQPNQNWKGNKYLQIAYYDKLQESGLAKGNATILDKDAREKTSVLHDLGLILKNREITDVGNKLLNIIDSEIGINNRFKIEDDAFLYLKQLLKMKFTAPEFEIRPFMTLIYLLEHLEYLTKDEFTYLLPTARTPAEAKELVSAIENYRSSSIILEDVLFEKMMTMDNYSCALELFISESHVTEYVIKSIGMNRKSRNYDIPYFALYECLKSLRNLSAQDISLAHIENIQVILNKISGKTKPVWKKYLLGKSNTQHDMLSHLKLFVNSRTLPINDIEFKKCFFKKLHVFKWKVNLSEYSDLNERFFRLSDILIFEDGIIKLTLYAKHFFKLSIDNVFLNDIDNDTLVENTNLVDISSFFNISEEDIASSISQETGEVINRDDVDNYIRLKEEQRFYKVIENKFQLETLIDILNRIENREDKKVKELVTDNANVPTIYEYIIGIAWYYISNKNFNLKDSLNMSLDADFLPKLHATGGMSDIIVEYTNCEDYNTHTLMLEVTLTNGTNQRRAEMEPVSRHLGNLKGERPNEEIYAVFISNYLDRNTIFDFRSRKFTPFFHTASGEMIQDNKIIPINNQNLTYILSNNIKYPDLYNLFKDAYISEESYSNWWELEINNKLS